MKLWVGVTDLDWFDYLAARSPGQIDEVNFWQPSGTQPYKGLPVGGPFLFKLKSPRNVIAGGGFFVRFTRLPCSVAWEAFGIKNGVPEFETLRARIAHYRRGAQDPHEANPVIGCNLLAEPFFLKEQDWIPTPAAWARNIVQGRSYDTDEPEGAALWAAVSARWAGDRPWAVEEPEPARFGNAYLTRPRLGQGSFRVLVTDAYERRCAITGERTLPALDAAHIKPYAADGPHRVSNGLLLRSDLHRLFDTGYLTVTPELRVEISPRIREEYENGRVYYACHGQPLAVIPIDPAERPLRDFLEWHNTHRFMP